MVKCPICNKKFSYPARRGRRSLFCSPECRAKYKKVWRKLYDAQGYVKLKKRKREAERWRREKQVRDRSRLAKRARRKRS